jgi:hypothetical protein
MFPMASTRGISSWFTAPPYTLHLRCGYKTVLSRVGSSFEVSSLPENRSPFYEVEEDFTVGKTIRPSVKLLCSTSNVEPFILRQVSDLPLSYQKIATPAFVCPACEQWRSISFVRSFMMEWFMNWNYRVFRWSLNLLEAVRALWWSINIDSATQRTRKSDSQCWPGVYHLLQCPLLVQSTTTNNISLAISFLYTKRNVERMDFFYFLQILAWHDSRHFTLAYGICWRVWPKSIRCCVLVQVSTETWRV